MSKETISRITDKVVAEMNEWTNRPTRRRVRGGVHRRDPRAQASGRYGGKALATLDMVIGQLCYFIPLAPGLVTSTDDFHVVPASADLVPRDEDNNRRQLGRPHICDLSSPDSITL